MKRIPREHERKKVWGRILFINFVSYVVSLVSPWGRERAAEISRSRSGRGVIFHSLRRSFRDLGKHHKVNGYDIDVRGEIILPL